jgi:hypothetical protein
MHSAEQSEWVRNHQRYVDYTNEWLGRFGIKQRMDFRKSDQFRVYSKSQSRQDRSGDRLLEILKSLIKQIPGVQTLYTKLRKP